MHRVFAKGILSAQNGMNIYRGCTHGCIYCDSRSECYNMQHDFEDIEVKQNAPELLADALKRRRRRCMIGTGGMCDPYMHCESELGLMRSCLEIIKREGFGIAVQTKSDRILRDIDLYDDINRSAKAVIQMTLTTYDEDLCRIIEPNVCTTRRRFETILEFKKRGIPTVVWLSPILPFINDTEENLRGILDYCFRAGVKGIINFGFGLTLRQGNREYFYAALDKDFHGMSGRYIGVFGNSYECASPNNQRLSKIFHEECHKRGVMHNIDEIFAYLHHLPEGFEQFSLF